MIWLAWRQFRVQASIMLGLLVAVAIVAALTGPHLSQVHNAFLIACKQAHDCDSTTDPVSSTYHGLAVALQTMMLLLPLLLGLFWGAPLIAREFETGTYRLAWSQSVSRRRWVMVKIGLVVLSAMLAAGALSLIVTWWSSASDAAQQDRFGVATFGLRGVVPIAYAAFACAFGVAAGALLRKVVPAMATTLVAYVVARVAVALWVRPHFMSPVLSSVSLLSPNSGGTGFSINAGSNAVTVTAGPPIIPNAWVVSSKIVDGAGQSPTQQVLQKVCPNLPGIASGPASAVGQSGGVHAVPTGGQGAFPQCITKLAVHYHELAAYQPASRYWAFQGLETGVFLVLAVALAALTLWWVRHRVA